MNFVYDIVFLLYGLVYLPYLLLTRRGYTGFGMRFGFFSPETAKQIRSGTNIWVHAVSVGEVMVIDGFIEQLRINYPSYQLIATVTTKTGYGLAKQRLKDKALVIPSPVDLSFVVKRFVSLIEPKIYIAVETEIWPNLYRQLYVNKIPMAVINGRISDASFGRYKAIRFLLQGILNQVCLWCMQSQRHADRILEMGVDPSRVKVTGNIKFDDLTQAPDSVNDHEGCKTGYWWVAGSTHPGEEEIALDVYKRIIKDNPTWRLVIAPRHIDRVPKIIELITSQGFKAVKFSHLCANPGFPTKTFGNDMKGETFGDSVVVVDTIGQLRSLYSLASLVFVGKSLCLGGGHNIIEPAFYGKAIIIGPKVENFRDIVACFKEAGAVVQVEDADSFEAAVRSLCADPTERERLGTAAKKVIAANQGATRRSLEHLAEFIK